MRLACLIDYYFTKNTTSISIVEVPFLATQTSNWKAEISLSPRIELLYNMTYPMNFCLAVGASITELQEIPGS